MIEWSEFTQDKMGTRLESMTDYGEAGGYYGAKLMLHDFYTGLDTDEIYVNEESYNRIIEISNLKLPGPGGAKELKKSQYVLVKEGDRISQGRLDVSIVIQN